jgi:DNA sulfur modification protein DndB
MKSKLILPSLRGVVGDWVYYSSIMNASQIHDWISAAKDIRESKALDEILQRDLKERKLKIANYLLKDESRFFNSIIVGIFDGVPDWVEFDLSKAQNEFASYGEYEALKESVGLLIFHGDEKMFAIDGQHRVAGIQIAHEMDISKAPEKRVFNDDQFSVIFIAHSDDSKGRRRTRKLFSDINNNAKAVAPGDKLKIDEESLDAIVTRKVYAEYSFFQNGNLISLTEGEKLNINDTDHFTNLLGLNNTNRVLKKLFKKVPKSNDWDEVNINNFYTIVTEFYDFIIPNVNSYREYFIDKTINLAEVRKDNNNLLFRPVGIKILAGLYVHFYLKNKLTYLKSHLNSLDFVMPNSPFNKVLWNKGKMEARELNQKIALELSLYLFGELDQIGTQSLLEKYRELLKNNDISLPKKMI